MADDIRSERSSSSAPSEEADLDAALDRMESIRANNWNRDASEEQEVDEDDTTEADTTTERAPDDDSDDDDFETDEANTPEDDADDVEIESQERQRAERQQPPEKGKRKAAGTDSGTDDEKPLSRKERGRLIAELRQDLEREQQEKENLTRSLESRRQEDERLNHEIDRALGTQDEFDRAMEEGLAGDDKAAEKARIWKANRAFYGKLLTRSQREASESFTNTYWQHVASLPGVTETALKAPSLADVLKNLYDAGVSSVKDSSSSEIEKLKNDLSTLRGRYRTLKLQAGGNKQSPLGSGGDSSATVSGDWKKKYIKNGVLTDEAEEIVNRYGFEALMNPSLKK